MEELEVEAEVGSGGRESEMLGRLPWRVNVPRSKMTKGFWKGC